MAIQIQVVYQHMKITDLLLSSLELQYSVNKKKGKKNEAMQSNLINIDEHKLCVTSNTLKKTLFKNMVCAT